MVMTNTYAKYQDQRSGGSKLEWKQTDAQKTLATSDYITVPANGMVDNLV